VASSGARGKTRKEITMRQGYHGRGTHHSWVGIIGLMAVLLVASVEPGYARGGAHGFGGHRGFRGHHGFGGPHVFLGIGPYWGPYWAPYAYPPVVVAPPAAVYVEPSAPGAAPPPPLYWYYCDNPQGYYPYVQQCPGGWRPVIPTPP
jgi:hypothetical protein